MTNGKRGQALILILLVMAVSLTLGVSVASRSIATLKQVSFSAQSAQALAFAEAGAEEALKCLDNGSCAIPSDPPAVDLTGDGTNDFDYRITALGGAVLDVFPPLPRDETLELNLSGCPAVNIYWVNRAKPAEMADPAAVVFAAIYQQAGVYKILRSAYDPNTTRRSENGFSTPTIGNFNVNGVFYRYRVSVSVPPTTTPIAMRVRPLYSVTASSFAFSTGAGCASLPIQGARIESTGFSGSVIRKIEALRTNPALSELFDFAIFSGSEASPLPN